MTKKWMVIMAMAGLFFMACKNDKQGETAQMPAAPQDTTIQTGPPPPANELGALEAQRWRLTSFVAEGATLQLPDSAHLTAVFDGTFVTGSAGCNDYRASYTKGDDNSLQISSLSHSSRTCQGLIGREEKYYLVLGEAGSYVMPDSFTLELKSGKGLLTYRAIENGVIKYYKGTKK